MRCLHTDEQELRHHRSHGTLCGCVSNLDIPLIPVWAIPPNHGAVLSEMIEHDLLCTPLR